MRIHAIQTGTVTIKARQVEGRGPGALRRLGPIVGRDWTQPLPIYCYAIEHPEGVIVVDTGDTARASEPGYFPAWHPYFRLAVRVSVAPEEEVGPQLEALGIAPGDVRRVVLTHLHTDHTGGLHHFPDREILVPPRDLELASGLAGRIRGYPNDRWPSWFAPAPLELRAEPFGPFDSSLALTAAGDVRVVPLPGHTPTHVGVVVDEGERVVLIAGDASYTEELMLRGAVDGVAPDERAARDTLKRIRALAHERPTVYLVAHDPDTRTRLADRRTVTSSPPS